MADLMLVIAGWLQMNELPRRTKAWLALWRKRGAIDACRLPTAKAKCAYCQSPA